MTHTARCVFPAVKRPVGQQGMCFTGKGKISPFGKSNPLTCNDVQSDGCYGVVICDRPLHKPVLSLRVYVVFVCVR